MVTKMDMKRTMHIVIAVIAATLAVAAALTYVVYKVSVKKAYDEKWKEYIDCGLA
jgi:hypothetical protein